MSTAALVPQTWELSGDDALDTLRRTGRWRLLRDAFQRMRLADGFSHARSLAFLLALVMVQATIAIVGLAAAAGNSTLADSVRRVVGDAVPGPAGQVLVDAIGQAESAAQSGRVAAIVIGLAGALFTGTTAMGQLERATNRLYGVEEDRPTLQKYGRAFVLTVTAGLLGTAAFLLVAFGRVAWQDDDGPSAVWNAVRWPVALVLMAAATALLLRWSPNRRQPAWSWLAFGAGVSVLLVFAVTAGLRAFFRLSRSLGDTYGPLAGVVGLLLWAALAAIGLLFGAAVAAQLEAVRAGARGPQDPAKAHTAGSTQREGVSTSA